MKTKASPFVALGLIAFLSACATSPGSGGDQGTSSTSAGRAAAGDAPDPSPLRNAGIPSGYCGMILWSQFGARVEPVFRSVGGTSATISIDGEQQALQLLEQRGSPRFSVTNAQRYGNAASGLDVDTRIDWGQAFPSGSYIKGGRIEVRGPDGWSRIIPVAGIAGCKA